MAICPQRTLPLAGRQLTSPSCDPVDRKSRRWMDGWMLSKYTLLFTYISLPSIGTLTQQQVCYETSLTVLRCFTFSRFWDAPICPFLSSREAFSTERPSLMPLNQPGRAAAEARWGGGLGVADNSCTAGLVGCLHIFEAPAWMSLREKWWHAKQSSRLRFSPTWAYSAHASTCCQAIRSGLALRAGHHDGMDALADALLPPRHEDLPDPTDHKSTTLTGFHTAWM